MPDSAQELRSRARSTGRGPEEEIQECIDKEYSEWTPFLAALFKKLVVGHNNNLARVQFEFTKRSQGVLRPGPFFLIRSVTFASASLSRKASIVQCVRDTLAEHLEGTCDFSHRVISSVSEGPSGSILVPLYDPEILRSWRNTEKEAAEARKQEAANGVHKPPPVGHNSGVARWIVFFLCMFIVVRAVNGPLF